MAFAVYTIHCVQYDRLSQQQLNFLFTVAGIVIAIETPKCSFFVSLRMMLCFYYFSKQYLLTRDYQIQCMSY